jgi:membrane protein DedA with SNARE-associated domain
MTGRMELAGFKAMTRGLVIGLAVVVALVSYDITIPTGESAGRNWKFVLTHPTILLHVIAATIVVIGAIALVIRSARNHNSPWIVLSVLGLAFALLAFAAGENYVRTLHNSNLSAMSIGWAGGIVTFGIGWYWSHRAERQAQKHLSSATGN